MVDDLVCNGNCWWVIVVDIEYYWIVVCCLGDGVCVVFSGDYLYEYIIYGYVIIVYVS